MSAAVDASASLDAIGEHTDSIIDADTREDVEFHARHVLQHLLAVQEVCE